MRHDMQTCAIASKTNEQRIFRGQWRLQPIQARAWELSPHKMSLSPTVKQTGQESGINCAKFLLFLQSKSVTFCPTGASPLDPLGDFWSRRPPDRLGYSHSNENFWRRWAWCGPTVVVCPPMISRQWWVLVKESRVRECVDYVPIIYIAYTDSSCLRFRPSSVFTVPAMLARY